MASLDIRAELCSHQQVLGAHCDACIRACPRNAWHMHPEGLGFDAEACDACGLCVNACPCEALALPGPTPLQHTDAHGTRSLLLACERAPGVIAEAQTSPGTPLPGGITPCLYALSPGWLLQQAQTSRAHTWQLAPGDCTRCERGAVGKHWRTQWAAVADRLHAQCAPVPTLRPVPASAWIALAQQCVVHTPLGAARRRLLSGQLGGSTRRAASAPPLTSARADTVQKLAAPPPQGSTPPRLAPPLWAVRLDATRCTACLACARLCPTGALRLLGSDKARRPEAAEQLILDMHLCTGCGLCQAVCDADALSPPHTPALTEGDETPAATTLALARHRCPICGVHFHTLGDNASSADSPPRQCLACQHGRPARHNRLVQQDTPA